MRKLICAHCKEETPINPRCKTQEYCGKPDCQRARKNKWQRQKMIKDPDYRSNQQACLKSWREKNKDYWKAYREKNKKAAERNRILQRVRNKGLNQKTPPPEDKSKNQKIAKMDTLDVNNRRVSGTFWLVPKIAKMDTLLVLLTEITEEQNRGIQRVVKIAKKDSIGFVKKRW